MALLYKSCGSPGHHFQSYVRGIIDHIGLAIAFEAWIRNHSCFAFVTMRIALNFAMGRTDSVATAMHVLPSQCAQTFTQQSFLAIHCLCS